MSTFQNVGESWGDNFFALGCPLNNLAQEMSPIDDEFRGAIEVFMSKWQKAISIALNRGQNEGLIKDDVNCLETARFIITVIEGAFGQAKITQDKEAFFMCGKQLERYLGTLVT